MCDLLLTNGIVFIMSNWLELIALGYMIYKIKDIKDELNIKNELVVISIVWFFFSMFYIIGRYL